MPPEVNDFDESLRQSVEDCKLARAVAALIDEGVVDGRMTHRPRFWEALRDACEDRLPKEEPAAEEPEERVCARARRAMFPRGEWKDHSPAVAPASYVEWWLEQSRDGFVRLLEQYVKTEEFRYKQRAERDAADEMKPSWMTDED